MIRVPGRSCLVLFTSALVAITPTTWAADAQDAKATVDKARIAFEDIVESKDDAALRSGLKSAKGVLIFPSIIKGGAIVGDSVLDVRDTLNHADYGKTVTSCDILVRGGADTKPADALRAAVAAAAR
jgi:lipid-binding SYLF domain-containing protein